MIQKIKFLLHNLLVPHTNSKYNFLKLILPGLKLKRTVWMAVYERIA